MEDHFDSFTQNRYDVMRELLLAIPDLHEKIVLDLGAGNNAISSGMPCGLQVMLDILPITQPSVICDFTSNLPCAGHSVDVVIAGEILEHITESRHFVREIRRVLSNGGCVILSVPNIVSLKYRVAFLLGKIPAMAAKADYTYAKEAVTNPRGHVRDYSFTEVRRVLFDQGFHVTTERSIGLHVGGKRVIPSWMMPITFSDNVVEKAVLQK
jgi:predicted SAM-dependent methyltransferase